jgi:hypothetical protein
MRVLGIACLLLASGARAQTMLDQELRLVEIHSLLIALQPGNAPGAYRAGEISLGLEIVTIPPIDGTTGGKRQITASDRTPLFPRPRFAIGLPAPADFRAYVGLAYIPPIAIREVSSHLGALDAGLAWAPGGPLTAGLRGYLVAARSQSPVTDPATRDTLDTLDFGADLSAGYRFDFGALSATPFAGAGVARVAGDFTVTADGYVLSSRTTNPVFNGGVRLFGGPGIEAVAELVVFPGRLVHPSFRIAWVHDWFSRPNR